MVKQFDELRVYKDAFEAAMRIFKLSKGWPREERYSLTSQIRDASRSVCGNVAEAWRKRRYERHFVSKLSDADAEAIETRAWLRFAFRCDYIERGEFEALDDTYDRICGGLVNMMRSPERWCGPAGLVREEDAPYDPHG